MPVLIGTSGWQYGHWKQRFYPKEVPQRAWLEFYAERFATVELNNSFYRLPKAETFGAWRQRTPDDFVVAVKANRYITHIRRLREPADAVALFMDHARRLGDKLGPILLQLPPTLKADRAALDDTLAQFGADIRVAVEFRHESWFTDDVRRVLEDRGAALCLADRKSRPVTPVWRTAAWSFLRFHQGTSMPPPCYGRKALKSWAARLADHWDPDEDVYVFFNNDPRACALRDAVRFAQEVSRLGLAHTRVPDEEAPVL